MKAESILDTNFQGRVVVTNKLSSKPKQCFEKAQKDIEELVKNDNYILYITQDYSTNAVNFELKTYYYPSLWHKEEIVDSGIVNKIHINSKASRYKDAAQKTIADYKTMQEQIWIKKQEDDKTKELLKLLSSMVYLPALMIIGGVIEGTREISNELKAIFNKAKKLAIKKG